MVPRNDYVHLLPPPSLLKLSPCVCQPFAAFVPKRYLEAWKPSILFFFSKWSVYVCKPSTHVFCFFPNHSMSTCVSPLYCFYFDLNALLMRVTPFLFFYLIALCMHGNPVPLT